MKVAFGVFLESMKGFQDDAGLSVKSHREPAGFVRQLPPASACTCVCVYKPAHNSRPVIVMCYGQKDPGEETELPLITRSVHPTLSSLETGQCNTGGRHEHGTGAGESEHDINANQCINTENCIIRRY